MIQIMKENSERKYLETERRKEHDRDWRKKT